MRRVENIPGLDMIPMMGLCAVLIPMVLMAWTPDIAVLESSLPAL